MAKDHKAAHEEFSATFPKEVVVEWEAVVRRWEADGNALNPFEEPEKGIILLLVRPCSSCFQAVHLSCCRWR
jgi:hypothetical protein